MAKVIIDFYSYTASKEEIIDSCTVMVDFVMDVLHSLANHNLDVSRKVLDLALGLLTPF